MAITVQFTPSGPAKAHLSSPYLPGQLPLGSIFITSPTEEVEIDEAIFWEGDPAVYIFEVMDGVVRLYKMLPDGRRAITGFLYPGDVFGLWLQDNYLYTAEAVTP